MKNYENFKGLGYIYMDDMLCNQSTNPNAICILSRYLLDGKGKIITQTLS